MYKATIVFLFACLFLNSCKKDDTDSCSDQDLMDSSWSCPLVYDPVCGCDGLTYTNACIAKFKNGIRSFNQGACNCIYPETGIVVELGLANCNKMIRLESGKYLNPVEVPTAFELKVGTRVQFNYQSLNSYEDNCSNSENVKIRCIRETSCISIGDYQLNTGQTTYNDDVDVHFAQVLGDCITITFNYKGDCKEHLFRLSKEAVQAISGSNSILVLEHYANGDTCQSPQTKTMSFDLQNLQKVDGRDVSFILRTEGSTEIRPLLYIY